MSICKSLRDCLKCSARKPSCQFDCHLGLVALSCQLLLARVGHTAWQRLHPRTSFCSLTIPVVGQICTPSPMPSFQWKESSTIWSTSTLPGTPHRHLVGQRPSFRFQFTATRCDASVRESETKRLHFTSGTLLIHHRVFSTKQATKAGKHLTKHHKVRHTEKLQENHPGLLRCHHNKELNTTGRCAWISSRSTLKNRWK